MPIVWQLSVLGLTNWRTLVTGVVLKRVPYLYDKKVNWQKNFSNVCRSYFTRAYANRELVVLVGENQIRVRTDSRGGFRLVLDEPYSAEINIALSNNNVPLQVIHNCSMSFPMSDSSVGLISDIDDTVIVSHTATLLKRLWSVIFTTPHQRGVVEFTKKVFEEAQERGAYFFYISRSEANLLGAILEIIRCNALPDGMMLLTPYLSFLRLFNPQKGISSKLSNIIFIIENTDIDSFVLFGDDSQRDVLIYTDVVRMYPDKIREVYIRKTRSFISARRKRMMSDLMSLGVPVIYF
ncbi:MAG: phosphatase domain-containing protein [Bacteroidales bacterium]